MSEFQKTVEILPDVTVSYENHIMKVKGPKGELTREFYYPGIDVEVHPDSIVIDTSSSKRKYKSMVGTFASHMNNMIVGVTSGFEYKMTIVYSHFPMQTKVDGKKFIIGNFLGEKADRIAKIVGDTEVKISGNTVTVSGINKEDVGQTTANIEQRCRIKRFDPRVFQDGIYVVEK
ncbi:MAG: 50S ribosomal protein L6 [Methanosarcinaceae archaeon]|nr:50S ribosomal protein L6 [Methanosarcinaceae archaeon]